MKRALLLCALLGCGGIADQRDGGADATTDVISDATIDATIDAPGWSLDFVTTMLPLDVLVVASVQAADVTGDGRADVLVAGTRLVANQQESGLYVYPQANGALAKPLWYRTDTKGSGLVVGDVTGDSKSDAVLEAPNFGTGLQVLPQTNGSFADASVSLSDAGPGGDRIAIGNFLANGIGVAQGVASFTKPLWLWLPFNGSLAWAGQWSGTEFDRAVAGDLSGDGIDDLVVTYISKGSIAVWVQGGSGDFAPAEEHVYAAGSTTAADLVVGDITGDGLADIVVPYGGNAPDARLAVLAQLPNAKLAPFVLYDTLDLPGTARVVDMNGDGRNDVVVSHAGFNKLGIYLQTASGTLAAEQRFPYDNRNANRGRDIAVADIDGNGKPDVVGIASSTNELLLLLAK